MLVVEPLTLDSKFSEFETYVKFRSVVCQESAWVNSTTLEGTKQLLSSRKYHIFVAKYKNSFHNILGTIILDFPQNLDFGVRLNPDCVKLSLITVLRRNRHKGVGRALMLFALRKAVEHNKKEVLLTVNSTNTDAINFYKSMGYAQTTNFKNTEEQGWLITMTKSANTLNY